MTVRWGMIGCGDVAEVKSGPALYRARGSTLVAVMRRNGALAEEYARRHGIARWHDDADEVIQADDIDAVYVATPTSTHREYVLRCAAAGKAVYVEKPMGMSHDECVDMVRTCRAAGVPLWVAYYRRALPRFLAVKELIEGGAIGDVRVVRSERLERATTTSGEGTLPWRLDGRHASGGLFFDGACHTLDFLDLLFGPVEEVYGVASNLAGLYGVEDTVTASYRFRSGVLGSGSWCYAADRDVDRTVVSGTSGRLGFSTSRREPIWLVDASGERQIDVEDPPHVHQPLVQTIVDELNGIGRCPSTGDSAARTAWVTDRVLAGFRSTRRTPG
ncbi:Gfo/Idh/MocA family oxidoreductase [Geodermatophilus sp. YIM 151500]|uniref:Gfo/Idh/MocA family protein n=1 Tax=Geodermatophilus sp. YIM 151500 TaxID=2984531 RepID=UPI0021E516B1|nr:Gfo/Idh/MocA family oxidoreductase [Geodermatophilus sp. YIM 151500]MCV2489307.1 Gfo/Idh/MocA family oxidoreductase [Geodermatophilus sp. YIM 151500]